MNALVYSDFSDFFNTQNLLSRRKYHRPFNELSSVKIVHLENGSTKVFANVIGHNREDVEVTVTNAEIAGKWYLNINAETEHENLGKFTTDYQLPVRNKITGIDGVVKNGLLELTIQWDKTADPDVKVTIS